ncbi:MMP37-like protein [Thelonectria olida]|uniref:Phosphatidate cytidylyltransferase, mitochondrial n=1 Tax=Thelonectria olida TaxID=1576542 RepID=A0A9P8WBN2_9HYPO|nr:MMP37-like protein [Thelonectria olida]
MAFAGLRSAATSTSRALTLGNSSTIRLAPLPLRRGSPLPCRNPQSLSRWYSSANLSKTDTPKNVESESSGKSPSAQSSASAPSSRGDTINPFNDDWETTSESSINSFADLPHRLFGANQHMIINYELKEALRLMLRQFNAPIVYCFAYGSGVFPQETSTRTATEAEFRAGAPKMIDFIFGVTHVQHWHSINMKQHRDHYSGIASLGSGLVSRVQNWGAGVYFNPFIEMNGMLIKYGVTSIDNLVNDLSSWESLYLAGRLQKPVKILRDHPRVRLANQHNLIAAVRTALLLLPPDFTEAELYSTIAGLSYLGDPRMSLPTENKSKVNNIVDNNIIHFRRLYAPLIQTLPNVDFSSACRLDDENWVLNPEANNRLHQDMDPVRRGNMVRRLPNTFRSRLYFQYQKKFSMPRAEFNQLMKASVDNETTAISRRQGGDFEKRIATGDPDQLQKTVRTVIKQTVNWPSTTQSIKGILMGGFSRTVRYMGEKISKFRKGQKKAKQAEKEASKAKEE